MVLFTLVIQFTGVSIEVEKSPNGSGPAIVDVSVINTSNIHICYDDKDNAIVSIRVQNNGTDTLNTVSLGWFLAVDQTGTTTWNGILLPNSEVIVGLAHLNLPGSGVHPVRLWVDMGALDVNHLNDTVVVDMVVAAPFVVNELKDTSVCVNNSLSLNINSGYSSYNWSTGQTSASLNISSPGVYSVTVTNSIGCAAVDSVIIGEYNSPVALLPDDTVLCDSAILVPEVSEKFVSYTWGMGDTISNIVISEAGEYVLNVIDTFGCSYTDTINVVYAAPPIPSVPTQVFICDGDSAILSVANNFTTYSWSTGSNTSSISTTSSGLYYVTVTGSAGCVGIDTVQVLVNPLPNVEFTDSLMCNLSPIMLNVGWFSSFEWSNGDTVQNPVVGAPGKYSVTVTDQNGCENSDSVNVINQNVSVALGNDTSICDGSGSYKYILGNYDSYLWNDGHTGSNQFIGNPGLYSVTVTLNGCSAEDDLVVSSVPYPVADFDEIINSNTVDFSNFSNIYSNVTWDFGDGATSNQVSPTHIYLTSAVYEVRMTISNQCGVDFKTKNIGINPLSTNNMEVDNQLMVFPTLANDVIHISIESTINDVIEYTLFDATGKLMIKTQELYSGNLEVKEFDISSFASGTYFVKVASQNQIIGIKKFIKQ